MTIPEKCCFNCRYGSFEKTKTGPKVVDDIGRCLYPLDQLKNDFYAWVKGNAPASCYGSVFPLHTNGVEPTEGTNCPAFENTGK